MKRKDLESINNELFSALNLDDQQYIMGEHTTCISSTLTLTPNDYDADADLVIDWS